MNEITRLRQKIRKNHLADEQLVLTNLISCANISKTILKNISSTASDLVEQIRADDQPGLMEVFLAEYGLSSDEGVALMCLAEALLRVPDADTIDDLIEDKIAPSHWGAHLGKSSSSLVNASTWALMLTGKVLDETNSSGIASLLHGAIKQLGEPVIRIAVKRAMKEMGNQFVLGETIQDALERGSDTLKSGITYSYDMLGEAALTHADAQQYFNAYFEAITTLAAETPGDNLKENPGISVKLSALHPRYEENQIGRAKDKIAERLRDLAIAAKKANIGLNIDAEEADRLDLSLDIIEIVLSDKNLAGWDGFGIVVQAYSKRASQIIDWIYQLANVHSRKLMVRLVKGAYWDTEIKRAQVEGLTGFPVFTTKSATDISYICCAKKLLSMSDRIYSQFATHNAHTVCAIFQLAENTQSFEFQRLHGMGEVLHRLVRSQNKTRCRIYAPVGAHRDLLAYLVRRLLENGANSSFVNQLTDESISPGIISTDPFQSFNNKKYPKSDLITNPTRLFAPVRKNSRGFDLHNRDDQSKIDVARRKFQSYQWRAQPILASDIKGEIAFTAINPACRDDIMGTITNASKTDVDNALAKARTWQFSTPTDRNIVLNRAADLFEENFGEIFSILCREAGKNTQDAIAELREAVDFLRYYACFSDPGPEREPRGLIACISPWNFPLAIFTGQIAASLTTGNGVLAKPAEQTPIIANLAVKLLHKAGIPVEVLQLLPGSGVTVGVKLTADPRINGICFTGSTPTAQKINQQLANSCDPATPLIAETGGINAMIVDSTALPEQAVSDIIASAFQSAGQRCSALRILYLQEDIAELFKKMLFGAMDELTIGDPWEFSCDVGPVIDNAALQKISSHIDAAKSEGRVLKQLITHPAGNFIGPTILGVSGISDIEQEIFGPVLHLATFRSNEIDQIIEEINQRGYGLTFGLHTRIDDRVEEITTRLNIGNIYINRNQIGAVVGSQPFGGEGLSGTGPKAGGPNYTKRFTKPVDVRVSEPVEGNLADVNIIQASLNKLPPTDRQALSTIDLPGPTGESNRMSTFARGIVLCLGPTISDARQQIKIARQNKCTPLSICPGSSEIDGFLERIHLSVLTDFDAVALWSSNDDLKAARKALAVRTGPIIPLLTNPQDMADQCIIERHICIDTTASGGNAALLASTG